MLRRGPNALVYLCATVILLVAALIVYMDHPLVVLASDHANQTSLFTTEELAPGQSLTVSDTLSNQGVLPLVYSMEVSSPDGSPIPPGYRLQVRRQADGAVLFSGPLPRQSGPLGSLGPGQTVGLALTLSVSQGTAPNRLPRHLSWKWRGQAGVSSSWLLPLFEVFLGLAVLAIVGRWLVESRLAREENGWSRKADLDLSRRPGP